MVVFMDFIMGNVMDKMALPLPFYDGQVALDLVESLASFFLAPFPAVGDGAGVGGGEGGAVLTPCSGIGG